MLVASLIPRLPAVTGLRRQKYLRLRTRTRLIDLYPYFYTHFTCIFSYLEFDNCSILQFFFHFILGVFSTNNFCKPQQRYHLCDIALANFVTHWQAIRRKCIASPASLSRSCKILYPIKTKPKIYHFRTLHLSSIKQKLSSNLPSKLLFSVSKAELLGSQLFQVVLFGVL